MKEDGLLDEQSQTDENIRSIKKYNNNEQYKILVLGAIVFYSFMNIKFILEGSIHTIVNKYAVTPYLVYFSSQIFALILILIAAYFYFPRLNRKVSSNLQRIDSIIGIHLIFLVLFMIIYQLFYKILSIFDFLFQANSGFYYNQDYYNFMEIANPISHILSVLLLVFVIFKLNPTAKSK